MLGRRRLAKWDHRVPFSGRALEILHDARKRSARGGRTEAPSSRAAAQDVVAHTWPEATADDTTTGSGLIAALDADSARVTVDDTIAFYDTATARSATVVVAPNKTARVSRRRPRSSARDRTIKKMTQIGRCRWKQGLAQRSIPALLIVRASRSRSPASSAMNQPTAHCGSSTVRRYLAQAPGRWRLSREHQPARGPCPLAVRLVGAVRRVGMLGLAQKTLNVDLVLPIMGHEHASLNQGSSLIVDVHAGPPRPSGGRCRAHPGGVTQIVTP